MFDNLRALVQKLQYQVSSYTHTDFQDKDGHLYSVSFFSWEYVRNGFCIGGRFRRNPFARQIPVTDTDDCPF